MAFCADGALLQAKLEEMRGRIEELEERNSTLQETNDALESSISQLRRENEEQATEIANLRDRANLSKQNWIKERDELISREAYVREEFENAKQAMADWEVLAIQERSLREELRDRAAELEEQVVAQREAYEKAASERDTNSQAVDGLQRALQEVQNGELAFPVPSVNLLRLHSAEDRAQRTSGTSTVSAR